MSKDFQLAHPCPHLVLEEVVPLASDRRTLVPKAPVAASNVVRILMNDEAYVPQGGLFSQAQITGDISGPFRIAKCDTTLTVTSSTEAVSVELPVGPRLDAVAVAKILQGHLVEVAVEVVRGRLVFTDAGSYGLSSFILVGGNAASSLGFKNQRGAKGRKIYPAWELASQPGVITGRYPKFREPVKTNPMIKVSYVAPVERCPRCSATFVENDYRYDLQGDAILIENENLLYQAALKILLTRIQSNPYHPSYGSALTSRIGTKAIGASATLITEDVQRALSTMQSLQSQQSKFQAVSPKERLYAVTSVRVSPSPSDPTVFGVDVVVMNAAGGPISLTIVFTVPGVVALTGSNGLSLGLEGVGLTPAQSNRLLE
jgi:hypothetical protein